MSATPRSDAAANPSCCECDPGTVVNIRDARQLETELASVQLELGATKGELEEANQDAERLAVCLQALEGDCDIGSLARRALAMHESRTGQS